MHLAGIWVSLGDSFPLGLIHLCRGVGCVLTNMVLFWLVFNPQLNALAVLKVSSIAFNCSISAGSFNSQSFLNQSSLFFILAFVLTQVQRGTSQFPVTCIQTFSGFLILPMITFSLCIFDRNPPGIVLFSSQCIITGGTGYLFMSMRVMHMLVTRMKCVHRSLLCKPTIFLCVINQ